MTVSRARQMYMHGSWTIPQAFAYLTQRYNRTRLATELIDQWELVALTRRMVWKPEPAPPNSDIPREDLIALISTAYECKGITQLEAERLFRLLGMDVKEARSHLKMVEDNTLIVAIFGTPPTCTLSAKAAILDHLSNLIASPPETPDPIEPHADLVSDVPTYPNCTDECTDCTNLGCGLRR